MKVENFSVRTDKDNKVILKDINVKLRHGEMLCILGPSGSGKTTFLDVLTGNLNSRLITEGTCVLNGEVKFVSQEEKLHGFFSVRSYLKFYFQLNYGLTIDSEKEELIVNEVAESCGLTNCLDTNVGDIFFKGLSGGQKRRLSIALELISKPDILIVDEPTSGLDSYSSLKVMKLLKELTNSGILVICTIHQPSSEIWELMDKVLLISRGNICYQGKAPHAADFFDSIGIPLPKNYNPSDHYLMHINTDFDDKLDITNVSAKFLTWQSNFIVPSPTNKVDTILIENEDKNNNVNNLGRRQSKRYDRKDLDSIQKRANCLEKFLLILKRSLINILKNPGIFGVRLFMYIMLCFMIGVMFLKVGKSFKHEDIIARSGLLFYCDAFLVFMSIAVLPFYIIEREITKKEINNGLYGPFQYLFAGFLVSLIGIAVISIISTLFVVLLADLNGFGNFFLLLFLSLIVAESLTRLVSLLVPHYIIGMALVAGLYGMFMLTQGFLIIKDDIPGYLIWIYYIGFHTYSFEGFMFNEFNPIKKFESQQFTSGKEVLKLYSMDDTRLWMDYVILVAWIIVMELLCFITMSIKFVKHVSGKRIDKSNQEELLDVNQVS